LSFIERQDVVKTVHKLLSDFTTHVTLYFDSQLISNKVEYCSETEAEWDNN